MPPPGARLFDRVAAPRWTALTAASILAFAAIGMTTPPVAPAAPQAHLVGVVGVTLTHAGHAGAARIGSPVVRDDRVSVAAGGAATLVIGPSEIRLAGGASIEIERIDPDEVAIIQRAGRAWYRVAPATAGSFTVRAATVSWTTGAAAFDLARVALGGGRERLTTVAIEGSLRFDGPDLAGSLAEGRRASVTVGDELPDIAIGDVTRVDLADPWLVENARLDAEGGRPLGIFSGLPAATNRPPTILGSAAAAVP
ncbi:MAG TPA: hypothetical protein VFI34_07400 [Candidatus Limnocylindrales bacterium]|nr:hypothetical protein [Candidatus Limnocylindrales bacterium]